MLQLVLAQAAITYFLLYMAKEQDLISPPLQFFYYNMVTISTVGYGDFSPITPLGKFIVSAFQIPSGLIIFATFIGKVTELFINIARSNMNGNNDFYHLNEHILLLSWDSHSTEQVVELILGDKKRIKRPILLCVTDDMSNPFPDRDDILFAKLRTFSDKTELNRIAISKAKKIIIDGKSDDETLSIALSVSPYINKEVNITAHFFDKNKAELLKLHCPNIECSIDNSAQIMVRSMQDPGSSRVAEQLLSTLQGATLFSFQVPNIRESITFGELFNQFKNKYEMILIATSPFKNGDNLDLNPDKNTLIKSGSYLFYIANERINQEQIDWD
ncbi:potassium channel family protein [Psychromonas sp. MME2]|uniref:potassium channel family protein n=1 Tax=unclassified Psychromonas TaxID=2614957 RepID=UPI00339C76BA